MNDHDAGIVRVDTRDQALVDRIAFVVALHALGVDEYEVARAVVAELAKASRRVAHPL